MRLDIEDMSYEASIHGFGVVFPINVDYILWGLGYENLSDSGKL